jgi:hypothetical protein
VSLIDPLRLLSSERFVIVTDRKWPVGARGSGAAGHRLVTTYSVEKLNSCALGILPTNQFAAEKQP